MTEVGTQSESVSNADVGDVRATFRAAIDKARAASPPEAVEEPATDASAAPAAEVAAPAAGEAADTAKPADDKAPKVSDDPKMAAKFAALARKSDKVRQLETTVRAEQSRLAEREQRLVAAEQHLSSQAAEYRRFQEARRDPKAMLALMIDAGVSPESLVQHSLADSDPALRAEQMSKRALAEAEAIREENKRLKAEREQQGAQAAQREAEAEFSRALADDKYDAANTAFSRREALAVAYHIDKLAKAKGLSWRMTELAQAVNEFAEAGYELDTSGNVIKSERYGKVKARFAPSPAAPSAPTPASAATGPRATTATLTNRDANERGVEAGFEDLSPEARIRRIAQRARLAERS